MSKLIEGLIPPGKPCPWIGVCAARVDGRCPTEAQPKPVPYSCAAARAHDLIERMEQRRGDD